MKSLFEQMGITYRHEGEYLIPNITLPNEKNHPIGIWGQRHLRYLKQHRKVLRERHYFKVQSNRELEKNPTTALLI